MPCAPKIVIIGGGPAGLMAAEAAAQAGAEPHVYEHKPTLARKFLMAGKSGLNISHSEEEPVFLSRYGSSAERLAPFLSAFGPRDVRAWMDGLNEAWFTGSSGRVFPVAMKASPLLRRWVARLDEAGVTFHTRHRWTGWDGAALCFDAPGGPVCVRADAVILACGGASWPRLGSDGGWAGIMAEAGMETHPFRPSNVGFDIAWSDHFAPRFAGAPVKPVALSAGGQTVRGEFVVTRTGLEGSGVYHLASTLVAALDREGEASLTLDLLPDLSPDAVMERLARPRGKQSISNHLRKTLGLGGVKAGLLREATPPDAMQDVTALARALKALRLPILRARAIEEAISTTGGVPWDALDGTLMLRTRPGLFCAGEMIDWDAPTGGYLLTACLSTGRAAGHAAAHHAR